jgi:hypothetical protein
LLNNSDDDDYDIDFYTADPVMQEAVETQMSTPSPREQLEFLVTLFQDFSGGNS